MNHTILEVACKKIGKKIEIWIIGVVKDEIFMKKIKKKELVSKKVGFNLIATTSVDLLFFFRCRFGVFFGVIFSAASHKKYYRLVQIFNIFRIPIFPSLTLYQSNVLTRAFHLFFFFNFLVRALYRTKIRMESSEKKIIFFIFEKKHN